MIAAMRYLAALMIAVPAFAAPPEPERGPMFAPMREVEWRLTRIGDAPVQARRPVTLTLSRDGRASGNGGCNRYSGGFRMNAGTISFPGPLAGTMRACEDGMEIEQVYLERLAKGGRARVELGKRLRISAKGEPDLVFEKAATAAR